MGNLTGYDRRDGALLLLTKKVLKTMLTTAFLWLLLGVSVVYGGHEVLYKHAGKPSDVRPEERAIVQFDSRPLDEYWNTSSRWNKAYADKYGHKYMFLSSKGNCECVGILAQEERRTQSFEGAFVQTCQSHKGLIHVTEHLRANDFLIVDGEAH
jgi:hypothetical protein